MERLLDLEFLEESVIPAILVTIEEHDIDYFLVVQQGGAPSNCT